MIQLKEAADKASAPAESVEELYERLRLYSGSQLTVEFLRKDAKRGNATMRRRRTGRLQSLDFLDDALDGPSLILRIESTEEMKVELSYSSFEVLIDGQWKMIHNPDDLQRRLQEIQAEKTEATGQDSANEKRWS